MNTFHFTQLIIFVLVEYTLCDAAALQSYCALNGAEISIQEETRGPVGANLSRIAYWCVQQCDVEVEIGWLYNPHAINFSSWN